jgi:hypothetical protein
VVPTAENSAVVLRAVVPPAAVPPAAVPPAVVVTALVLPALVLPAVVLSTVLVLAYESVDVVRLRGLRGFRSLAGLSSA